MTWGHRRYLVAWGTERGDWRTFRADRIAPRPPAGSPLHTPPRPARGRRRRGPRGARGVTAAFRFRARVTVHAPAAVAAARVNPAVGVAEAIDDRSCVLATGADRPGVTAHICGRRASKRPSCRG
jgi:predicted DNA-binding transcriptional regulator YafY